MSDRKDTTLFAGRDHLTHGGHSILKHMCSKRNENIDLTKSRVRDSHELLEAGTVFYDAICFIEKGYPSA